jgi:hypothetical protein
MEEARNADFCRGLLLQLPFVQMCYSAFVLQTPSVHFRPSNRNTTFHKHTKEDVKLCSTFKIKPLARAIAVSTTCFNVTWRCILHTSCIYAFRMLIIADNCHILNKTNHLVFVMEMQGVYYDVRIKFFIYYLHKVVASGRARLSTWN